MKMNEKLDNLTSKPFKKRDILGFLILILIIAACFLFLLTKKDGDVNSATVYLKGKAVMQIYFKDEAFSIYDVNSVKKIGENAFIVESDLGFNHLQIDFKNCDIKVTDTDCGTSKECILMNFKDGVIICAPHNLVIKADGETPPPKVG